MSQPFQLFVNVHPQVELSPQVCTRTATCGYGGRELAWCATTSGRPPHPTSVLRRKTRSALYNACWLLRCAPRGWTHAHSTGPSHSLQTWVCNTEAAWHVG